MFVATALKLKEYLNKESKVHFKHDKDSYQILNANIILKGTMVKSCSLILDRRSSPH